MGIPLTLGISKVKLDDTEFKNPSHSLTGGKWVGQASSALTAAPTKMEGRTGTHGRIQFFHRRVRQRTAHRVVSTSEPVGTFATLEILDIIPQLRPFQHTLKNTVGQDYLARGLGNELHTPGQVVVEFA